jgi:hypothetical protein
VSVGICLDGLRAYTAIPQRWNLESRLPQIRHLDWVRASFSGLPANEGTFFAVYYPADANLTTIAALPYPATAPWTATAPAKWIMCADIPGCLTSGEGYHDFELVNPYETVRIVAFSGGINTPSVLVASEVITFTDNAAPLRGHITRTRKPDEMQVVWNTAGQDATQRVKFGTAPGAYTGSAPATPHTYVVSDLCGAHATTQGWMSPHIWQYALLTGLKPATVYYYVFGSDAGGWSDERSFLSAPLPGPNTPVNIFAVADM